MGNHMSATKSFEVSVVTGGFILSTFTGDGNTTEVFQSSGKLLKAIRTFIDDGAKKEPGEDKAE